MKPKLDLGTFYAIWPGKGLGLFYSSWGLHGAKWRKKYWLSRDELGFNVPLATQ